VADQVGEETAEVPEVEAAEVPAPEVEAAEVPAADVAVESKSEPEFEVNFCALKVVAVD
jgi:hypothetical protein